MKNSDGLRIPRSFIIICVALFAVAILPLLSRARTTSTSVNVVNNSSGEIRSLYSSHVNSDDWSASLLGNGSISSGASYQVSDVSCDAQQVKLIAEDQDGCFTSTVITCGQSSTWTITNDSTKDCGR